MQANIVAPESPTPSTPDRANGMGTRERPAYRLPEIEYMRALAVSLVIAHHLGVLPGGFIGVDIFFVISGFVISQALDASRHLGLLARLKHFYYRRIIRIVPPLFVVSLVSLLFAWLLFFDAELGRVQGSLAAQAHNPDERNRVLAANAVYRQQLAEFLGVGLSAQAV